jgi:anti-anti-sigma factor
MNPPGRLFEVERDGDTVIVTPVTNLSEVDYVRIEQEGQQIVDLFRRSRGLHLILDFHRSDYYGSTALAYFVKMWKWVSAQGGKMVLCNVSVHEREILEVTRLATVWPICPSRAEALEAVHGATWVGP